MKILLLLTTLVMVFLFAKGQKRSNVLVDAGVFSFTNTSHTLSYTSRNFTKVIGSIVYSYGLKEKFAIGLGIEVGQIPQPIISKD
jgi:hypothetical protein